MKSRKPKALEPGNYTVILEPRPAARFLSLMMFALNARAAEEGRSFMSGKERGTTKLGQKIFGDNVTIRSDVGNDILRQTPVGPEGLAARPITWVEKGVVKNLFYDRYWAKKQDKPFTPTSPNQSLVMDGGDATVEQMIKSTKRGLLVSFFWYIRPVEQMTLLNTGMTRDGLFLIENGEIAGPVQNFRWNDGPARGFNNITMLGRPVPMHIGEAYDNPGTALVPAMKIEDFRMTSISPAVLSPMTAEQTSAASRSGMQGASEGRAHGAPRLPRQRPHLRDHRARTRSGGWSSCRPISSGSSSRAAPETFVPAAGAWGRERLHDGAARRPRR